MISLQRRFLFFAIILIGINSLLHIGLHVLFSHIEWTMGFELLFYLVFTLLILAASSYFVVWNSRKMALSIRLLSRKIAAMSRGERDLRFTQNNTFELQEIVRAAEVLQYEITNREKERRQWTQDITHDLRTPITAIKTQLQAVKDGIFSLDSDRYDLLFRELGIIEKMVQDFALLSRIESPEMGLHQRWVFSQRLCENITNRFTALAHEQGFSLESKTGNFYFKADEDLFLRAASNLVQNAFQHTPEGGHIQVELIIRKNQILLTVENPGSIPEEDLPHIFQRLYRGEKSRTTSGSGLGLTIAKSIAQLHRGDISAVNTNRGTTVFEMTINMAF